MIYYVDVRQAYCYNHGMDNSFIKKLAYDNGFAACFMLPPPDEAVHDDEPNIVWNAKEYPWVRASALLVWAYKPYPAGERIPSYYINSNLSYHASVAIAKALQSEGVECLRAEIPIKQMAVKYGIAEPLRSSLVSVPPFGTRMAFQSMLLGEPFKDEEYGKPKPSQCGACRACINACPAHAISEKGLDVEKCMRFYMDRADYPDWVYDIQTTHLGCEVCQQVCPRNAHVPKTLPSDEIREAFDLDSLASGNTKKARLLVGKNMTGNGKLTKEAVGFKNRMTFHNKPGV